MSLRLTAAQAAYFAAAVNGGGSFTAVLGVRPESLPDGANANIFARNDDSFFQTDSVVIDSAGEYVAGHQFSTSGSAGAAGASTWVGLMLTYTGETTPGVSGDGVAELYRVADGDLSAVTEFDATTAAGPMTGLSDLAPDQIILGAGSQALGDPANITVSHFKLFDFVLTEAQGITELRFKNPQLTPWSAHPFPSGGTLLDDISGNDRDLTGIGTPTYIADEPTFLEGDDPAGSTELEPDDLDHAHTLDEPTLTQAHVLAVDDMAHGHALEAPEVSVSTGLEPADLAHTHALDAVALTQANQLAVAELAHAHALEAVTIEPTFLLTVADMLVGHTMEDVELTQANVLAVADLAHDHPLEAVVLTAGNELAVDGLAHGHALDGLTLTQANALTVAGMVHAHAVDGVTLSQAHQLVVAALAHAHALEAPTLSLSTLLEVGALLHAHAADEPTLSQSYILTVADAAHGHELAALALTQANVLAVAELLHAHTLDVAVLVLPGGVVLFPPHIRNANVAKDVANAYTGGRMLQSEERLEVDPEAAGKVTVRFHEKLEDDEVITAISAAVIQRKTSSGPPPVYATATGIEVSASEIVNAIDDDGVTELGTSQAVQLTISDSDADVSTPERGRDYRIVTTVTISGRSTPLVSKNPLTLRA